MSRGQSMFNGVTVGTIFGTAIGGAASFPWGLLIGAGAGALLSFLVEILLYREEE